MDVMGEFSVPGDSVAKKDKFSTVYRTLNLGAQPRSCSELLAELHIPSHLETNNLEFGMADGRDVYNITAPFEFNGKTLLIGRVERRDTEFSEIVIFEQGVGNRWNSRFTHPGFQGLQDPCVTWAGDELILGGVRYPVPIGAGAFGFKMDFYRGSSLESLQHFLSGPPGMKDIRFKQLPTGHVAIFSRPQGDIGGRGEIGFTISPSWDAITAEMIAAAPLFERQMLKEEWGGANEVHLLVNGHLGILGHIACFDAQRNRHYYPMAFTVDPATRISSPICIIAQRSFFPTGASKRPDLVDVVFSGGIIRNRDGTVSLYAGTSDAAAAVVKLPDPFLRFES
jgi:Protein of unknown function (DUF1861)